MVRLTFAAFTGNDYQPVFLKTGGEGDQGITGLYIDRDGVHGMVHEV